MVNRGRERALACALSVALALTPLQPVFQVAYAEESWGEQEALGPGAGEDAGTQAPSDEEDPTAAEGLVPTDAFATDDQGLQVSDTAEADTGDGELASDAEAGSDAYERASEEVESTSDDQGTSADEAHAAQGGADEGEVVHADELAQDTFTMPDGADYVSEVALVKVDPEADPAEVSRAISATQGVVARELTAEEVSSGLVEVELEPGVPVEDAVNELLASDSDVVEAAQPDYVYYPMDLGDASDLWEEIEYGLELADEGWRPQGYASEEGEPSGAELLSQAAASVNDPRADAQWALSSIKAYEAWSAVRSEHKVTVAVVDGGVDVTHEDLRDNVLANYAYDAVSGKTGASAVSPDSGLYSHATHVSGIIAATANNGVGIAGVSYNAQILPIKVFSGSSASTSSVVKAYNYLMGLAKDLNIRVVNLSVGARDKGTLEGNDAAAIEVITRAHQELGIVTVAAAGNSSLATPPFAIYPGDYSPVVSVINLERQGTGVKRNVNSNYNVDDGKKKNISAPGTDIVSTIPRSSSYGSMSGTSMAAPCVVGVLALEFAARPSLTASQAVSALYESATDLGQRGWDREYGYGEVNAKAAVDLVSSGATKTDISGATVTLSQDAFVYDGSAKTPAVAVSVGGSQLVQGVDYSVSYANNVEVGTGQVTITAKGQGYTGTTSRSFRIARNTVANAQVTLAPTSFVYSGAACTPQVTVEIAGTILAEGVDYLVSYANNVDVGTGQVTVSGKGDYIGTLTKTFAISSPSKWQRLAGKDALASMQAVVGAGDYATGGLVVLATTDGYWDALTAAGLAGLAGAPVVMCAPDRLSPETQAVLSALQPKTIVVCGGRAALSEEVEAQACAVAGGAKSVRCAGADALETANQIFLQAEAICGASWMGTAFVATGDGYWDALSAAPVSYARHLPIFLVHQGSVAESTLRAMQEGGVQEVYLVGGTAAISSEVEATIRAAGITVRGRVSGRDAIATSTQVAEFGLSQGMGADRMGVATGTGYWDALSGAALCGRSNSVLVLVNDASSSSIADFVNAHAQEISTGYVLGGTAAVDEDTLAALEKASG